MVNMLRLLVHHCLAAAFWLALTLYPTLCAAQSKPFRLAYSDVSTYPWQVGEGLDMAVPAGIAIDIIRQAAQDTGIAVEFLRLPNKRVLLELQSGVIDGAFIFSHNPERQTYAEYPRKNGVPDSSLRLARLSYYLYRKKNSPVMWNGSQFQGLQGPVGANSGYSIIGDLRKLGVMVEEAKSTEQNFNKLQLGRLDAVATQDNIADPHLQKNQMHDIEKLPVPLIEKDYFLIFNRHFAEKNRPQVERLWNRISMIRDQMVRTQLPHYPPP
jgi:polar amino acid transport system substrate-binding protein